MAEVNEAEEKKKQQQRDIDKEIDRKRFEDMGAGNEQFARENGVPNASTYDASGLSGIEYTDNSLNSRIQQLNAEAKNSGNSAIRMVEQPMNEEENDVGKGAKNIGKVADIMSLAIGNGNDAVINSTYNSIDFDNLTAEEQQYLVDIGCDRNTDLEEASKLVSFADGEENFGAGTATVDVQLADGSRATISQAEIDQLRDSGGLNSGTFTLAGHTETITVKEDRNYQFTSVDKDTRRVDYTYTDKNGEVHSGSQTTDLTGNAVIDGHAFSGRQLEVASYASQHNLADTWAQKAAQATAMGNLDLAAKYTHASEAWAQKSVVTAQFTDHTTVQKQLSLNGATVLDKNGVLTKFTGPDAINQLIGSDYGGGLHRSHMGAVSSASFAAAGRMDGAQLANVASGGSVVGNKAAALQNMANNGYRYLCNDANLSGKLTKTNDASVRLKDVNAARASLVKELKAAKAVGDTAKINALTESIAKIDNYKKFGGKVTDYRTSNGLSAAQRRGIQTIVGTTGVLSSDVFSPIMQARNSVNTVKSLVTTAGNAGAKIRRRMAGKHNARMDVLNKVFDSKLTNKLATNAQKRVDKLNYIDRKSMARGRGGEAWKNFKMEEKLGRMQKAVGKKDAGIDLIRKKQERLLDRQKVLNDRLSKVSDAKKARLSKKDDRLQAKIDKLDAKRNKYSLDRQKAINKKSKFEERLARRNDKTRKLSYKAKEKFKNLVGRTRLGRGALAAGSTLGKIGNFFSTKFASIKAGIGKFFNKLFNLPKILAGYVVLFIGSMMLITSLFALCAQYVHSFFGWLTTPPKSIHSIIEDAVFEKLDGANINYNQYIIDKTGFELGNTFVKVAAADAKWHYLLDSLFETAPSGGNGTDGSYAFDMDWYKALDKAGVKNIWMREEADNTTQDVDANGKPTGTLAFGETYIADEGARTPLDGVNVNLMPILSMANRRMDNATDYRNFRSVQAYCYYLWVATHDKAVYDDKNGDGVVEGEDEDAYTLVDIGFCSIDNLTDKHNVWDPDARAFVEPLAKGFKDGCTNIYYHGYSRKSFGVFGGAKLMAAKFVDGLEAFMKGKDLGAFMTPISTELSCTPGLDVMSGNWEKSSEYSVEHMKEDGTVYTTASAFENDKGEMACLNFTTAQWSTDETAYIEEQRNAFTGELSPTVKKAGGSGNVWGATTCGYDSHDHSGGWVEGVCDTENCPYKDHVHDATCPQDNSHNYKCDAALHTHTTACCSLEHEHEPWLDYGHPGCWTTIVICQGHCGGHIEAEMNVVVMNTWESLMKMDNFKMCHFLDDSCFETFLHWDHLIFDLDVWMFIWRYKVHSWFVPLDQGLTLLANDNGRMEWNKKPSKGDLAKTGCIGSDEYKKNKTDEEDSLGQYQGEIEDNIDHNNKPKSSDPDYENWLHEMDLYMFDGWWADPKTIYKPDPSGMPRPVTIPGSYEKALNAMRQLYGDNDDNWNAGRIAWGGGGFKDGSELGNEIGVQFPKEVDAKDPGAFYKYAKKKVDEKEKGKGK